MFKVLCGTLTLFEGPENYRPAEDSFWLSALAPPPAPACACVLDMGCGTGAVGLSYKLRYPHITLLGVDHSPAMLKAAQSAALVNNLPFELTQARIENAPYAANTFDLCLANPPFYIQTREAPAKTGAKQNVRNTAGLTTWLKTLLTLTKPQGHVALICHSHDAAELINTAAHAGGCCARHFQLKTNSQKPAKRSVLVFVKGQAEFKILEIKAFDPHLRQQVLEKNKAIYQ